MIRVRRPPKAGIQDGDQIVSIDGKENPTWEDIGLKEVASAREPVDVTVLRHGKRIETTVTPRLDERSGVGFAGWSERGEIQIRSLFPGMPAAKAGLQKDDQILTANGQPIHSVIKFNEIIRNSKGKPVAST